MAPGRRRQVERRLVRPVQLAPDQRTRLPARVGVAAAVPPASPVVEPRPFRRLAGAQPAPALARHPGGPRRPPGPRAGTARGRSARGPCRRRGRGRPRSGRSRRAARRAGILPLHARRPRPLPHEPGPVQRQHRPGVAGVLDDVRPRVAADRVRVPAHPAREVPHPVRRAVARGSRRPSLRPAGAGRPRGWAGARRRGPTRPNRGASRPASPSRPRAHPSASLTSVRPVPPPELNARTAAVVVGRIAGQFAEA